MTDNTVWKLMYLGALHALGVQNVEMTNDLADLTRSDEECAAAISVMRRAQEGDRVWPAMAALREMRRAAEGKQA